MARDVGFCENLYAPNPDIAGRGVLITFMTHTMCYVFLGLVITPIVATFLAQIPIPPRQAASPSSFEGPANPSVLPSSSEDSSEEPGDSSAADSRTCRSSAHAAIVSMFTGQYVVGLAYVVTTFIKHKEMTYYHLRIVIGLCSINFVVLFVCEYTRKTIPGFGTRRPGTRRPSDRTAPWSKRPFQQTIRGLRFFILLLLHAGLLIYTHSSRENDTGFERCFPADTATFWFTVLLWGSFYWCFIILELGSSHENDANYDYKISRWLVALVVCVVFVIAQSVQLIYIMRAFRGPAGRMDSELELGFGQVLMFFMIAQLVAEFSRGLWLDLEIIHHHFSTNGGSFPRSFVIFCSVLVPLLPGTLRQEILLKWYSGPKKLATKSKQWLSSMLRKLSEWAHALSKKPLRKTKTTEMETPQQNSSTQSLEPEKKDENSPGTEGETPADASNSQEAADPDEILPVRPPEPSLSF